MITMATGNLLDDGAQALVNPVNTAGVMGKGLALEFRHAFPEIFEVYRAACRRGEVRPGRILAVPAGGRWVLHFPTKGHWRGRSRLEYVRSGLDDLVRVLADLRIRSVAVPALGCGHGGLDWTAVRPLIEARLAPLDIEVRLYAPVDG